MKLSEPLVPLFCFTAPRTCDELKNSGIRKTGTYYIDPDGHGYDSDPPIKVYCDLIKGSTKITHDQIGSDHRIQSCEEPGCSVHWINYKETWRQISFLIHLSGHCEQHIRISGLNCNGSMSWWTDKDGATHNYWDGHGDGVDTCQDQVEGHLTNQDHLPVTKFNFGGSGSNETEARFQLGPLYCVGKAPSSKLESPTSCKDLLAKGVTQVSFPRASSQ